MKSSFKVRSRVIIFFMMVFAGILLSKLFYVQVVNARIYSETADRQYATPSSDIYERGSIYFERKDGELVSAATQTSGFKIAINTEKLGNPENTYKKLSEVASVD